VQLRGHKIPIGKIHWNNTIRKSSISMFMPQSLWREQLIPYNSWETSSLSGSQEFSLFVSPGFIIVFVTTHTKSLP
jgi:hypothetical protein